MNTPLLTTKLFTPPLWPDLVSRQRLIAKVNEGVRRKLLLVSAPAGFGKTILLCTWAANNGMPVAWVSLDEGDNDPWQFWAYVCTAMQRCFADRGHAIIPSFNVEQPEPIRPLLTRLINEIAATPEPEIVLVLDDYQLIESQPVHEEVAYFLQHMPMQAHVILATRSDPPLPLARLRGRGQMSELRTADLRFLPSETAVFLNEVMGLNLNSDSVTALARRTEGWITGLQMAALSLRTSSQEQAANFIAAFTGTNRFVLDYLLEEVLAQQPAAIQDFLLQTSLLRRLNGELCEALTGGENGQEMLLALESANLFLTPLDAAQQWYRYHQLFADLLQKQLRQTYPERLPGLHRRASQWFAAHGDHAAAIDHALAAADFGRVVNLITQLAPGKLALGASVQVRRWLSALPEEHIQASPALCLAYVWSLLGTTPLFKVEPWIQAAEETLRTAVSDSFAARPDGAYMAQLTTVRALLARSRQEPVPVQMALIQEAIASVPAHEAVLHSKLALWAGLGHLDLDQEQEAMQAFKRAQQLARQCADTWTLFVALYTESVIEFRWGRPLTQIVDMFRDALEMQAGPEAASGGYPAGSGIIFSTLGCMLVEQNKLTQAKPLLERGLALGGLEEAQVKARFALARLLLAQGETKQLPDLESPSINPSHVRVKYAAALQAQIWRLQSRHAPHYLEEARHWAKTAEMPEADTDWGIFARLVRIHIMVAYYREHGEPEIRPYLPQLDEIIANLEDRGWVENHVQARIAQALAWDALAERAEALSALKKALQLAAKAGYVRLFLDEGPVMARLLYQVAQQGLQAEYAGKLLAQFPADGNLPDSFSSVAVGLVEPLTSREIEVLTLIAQGFSNQEIGLQLSISLGTVKRHAANIFGKLSVHKRTQAVAEARRLGILSQK